jgi:hypothetical protein
MKDGLHDGTLQLLTPQKLPVSFGVLGAHKILLCQLWLHFLLRSFRLNVQGKNRRKAFLLSVRYARSLGTHPIHAAKIVNLLLGGNPLLALGLWLGGRVWRYRRFDFCRPRLRWPKN